MQVSVESSEGLERRMTVELPVEQVNQEVEKRLKTISRTAKIDGFRPGKVPPSVIRKRYLDQVLMEVHQELIQSTYFDALGQENLQPAGDPMIEPVEKQPGEGFGYTAIFEVMPQIELGDMADQVIQRPVAEVSDEDVSQMIEKLRKQRTTWNDVERESANGDQVTINFKGTIDGEAFEGGSADNIPLELGSNSMIEGFEPGLVGAKAGENRTLELVFPEDYHAENLKGKDAVFEVEVIKVAEAVIPELDEEFIKAFGMADGTVETLQSEIRSNMERELEDKIGSMIKQRAMDALIAANEIPVPQFMVKQEAEALKEQTKQNMEQYGQQSNMDLPLDLFEDQAKRRVALGLIVAEVIKVNEIILDEEKVKEKVEMFAKTYEKPQEVIDYYASNREQLAMVQNIVLEEQVADWVMEQAKVEDVESGFEEITAPQQQAAE
ncbi:MAG: trigger factor [Gammaproteobacteria bacterium]|nr:trigger factor [Gammaproteobacteria bacterium]